MIRFGKWRPPPGVSCYSLLLKTNREAKDLLAMLQRADDEPAMSSS